MCWALRNPPRGGVKVKLADIRKMLKKKDGQRPGLSAIGKAAKTYKDKKEKRGRKKGTRATTKQEDAAILKAFHKATTTMWRESLADPQCFAKEAQQENQ